VWDLELHDRHSPFSLRAKRMTAVTAAEVLTGLCLRTGLTPEEQLRDLAQRSGQTVDQVAAALAAMEGVGVLDGFRLLTVKAAPASAPARPSRKRAKRRRTTRGSRQR
jgi:hypothetical protein